MQDFLAPELREIKARLEALEQHRKEDKEQVNARFNVLEQHTNARFDALEQHRKEDKDEILRAIGRLEDISHIKERLTRLEERGAPQQ